MKRTIVGIIGGMGPRATASFFGSVLSLTAAGTDQEHVHVVIDSDPTIPDRTAYLLGGGPDPRPHLVRAAKRLEAAGCGILVMPCNTAHAFADDIRAAVTVPLVDWIDSGAVAATEATSNGCVGVLATNGTVYCGLYQRALEKRGMRPLLPPPADQEAVMTVAYEIKGGDLSLASADRLMAVVRRLQIAGADTVILGCTELAIAVAGAKERWTVRPIDPAEVVARLVISYAGATVARDLEPRLEGYRWERTRQANAAS